MLLSGALLALFLMGFWLYCLTDVILTPAAECRLLSKPAWVAVTSVTFVLGAVAWLIVRRPARDSSVPLMPLYRPAAVDSPRWTAADGAVARHPAGRARMAGAAPSAKGPDDDPEFLRALGRAIRRNPPVS
jgi:Phospholipase_D-nuclease N-terminal